jgi:hypothetical protein
MSKAELQAELVFAACYRYLKKREKRIEERREKLIQDCMAFPRFWRKLFGKPAHMTREEAIEYLKGGDAFSEWHMIPISGGYWAAKVEDLKKLASIASRRRQGGTVFVDDEMMDCLHDYMDALAEEA